MTPEDDPNGTPESTQNDLAKTARRAKSPKQPWSPPRGIRYEYREDRPALPFYLHWRDEGGQRHKQAFKSEVSREIVAKELAEKRERHGSSILTFDPDRWRTFERFTEIVGAETDPLQVAREWKELKGVGAQTTTNVTVSKAVESYLELRKTEGGIDPAYLSHVKLHLRKSFAFILGHVPLHQLDAPMIREWLARLSGSKRGGKTGQLGIEARRHYYRSASTFLARCVKEGWMVKNPFDIVAAPAATKDELAASEVIKLMPVADVEKLFAANCGQRCVGRLALEAFGGVRYTTAGLMTLEHIDFDRRALAMPGHIHKSRKRKFRQGHPECLWAWLEHTRKTDCWTMTPREYYEEKRDAFVRADVKNPHNGLRHSFASYLLAATKNLPTVSYLMQHAKTTMTEKYEGRASEQDAGRYLAIVP